MRYASRVRRFGGIAIIVVVAGCGSFIDPFGNGTDDAPKSVPGPAAVADAAAPSDSAPTATQADTGTQTVTINPDCESFVDDFSPPWSAKEKGWTATEGLVPTGQNVGDPSAMLFVEAPTDPRRPQLTRDGVGACAFSLSMKVAVHAAPEVTFFRATLNDGSIVSLRHNPDLAEGGVSVVTTSGSDPLRFVLADSVPSTFTIAIDTQGNVAVGSPNAPRPVLVHIDAALTVRTFAIGILDWDTSADVASKFWVQVDDVTVGEVGEGPPRRTPQE